MPTTSRRLQAAKRWSFLSDWLKHLQKYLSYVERAELDSETLRSGLKSLCIYLPTAAAARPRDLRKLREAIQLVALLLLADKDAWLLLQSRNHECLHDFDPNDYDPSELTVPHFLFMAYASRETGGDTIASIAVVSSLLEAVNVRRVNSKYRLARDSLLVQLSARIPNTANFQVPISIVFCPDPTTRQHASAYIQQAKQLVETVCALGRQETSENVYPFKLTQVIFRPWEYRICPEPTGNDSIMSFVGAVLAQGVQIEELAVSMADSEVPALGELLYTAAHPLEERIIQREPRRDSSVETLMVTKSSLPAFTALCSALAFSTTIKRLHLYDSLDNPVNTINSTASRMDVAGNSRAEKWKWLGFALISRISQSSIRELYIDDDRLLLSDVAALKTTALSLHPIQELSGTGGKLNAVDRKVRLSWNAQVRLGSSDGNKYTLQDLPGVSVAQFVQVITDDTGTDYIQILVPGYGCGWVQGDSIIDVSVVDLPTIARPPPRLTSLRLAFNNCEKGALAGMLEIVGVSLVSLDIDASHIRLVQASDVTAILESCPNLKMFSLNRAKLGILELFTRAYEKKRCKIVTLSLCNVEVRNQSLRNFAWTLSDPSHAMTKTLRQFRYMYGDEEDPDEIARPNSSSVPPFLTMLETNRVLSFFELGLAKGLYEQFSHRFRELDGKLLVTHPADLPLDAKLAFLSCVAVSSANATSGGLRKRLRQSCDGSHQAQPALSRGLVALIFGFARKRIHRVVSATK